MHIALIIDEERLEQEQAMLNRLCIGLMAEGVQVTRLVPDRALPDVVSAAEKRVALARRVEVPMRVLPWMRRMRAARVAEQLEKAVPDVFYAIGSRAWNLGIDLARVMDRPTILDVWAAEQVRVVPAPSRDGEIAGYVAGSGAMARLLGRRVDPALVSMVPMGVSIPPGRRRIRANSDEPLAIAVIGGSRDVEAYEAMLAGLSALDRAGQSMQVFLEMRGRHEHDIWRAAEQHDLIRNLSTIGAASHYRSLLTRCDMLLMPEHFGEVRSICLEAMALGLIVVARKDPALDMLIHNETALLVDDDDPQEWTSRIRGIVADPDAAENIGSNARRIIVSHHRSSEQVSRLITTLERVFTGGAYRLSQKPS